MIKPMARSRKSAGGAPITSQCGASPTPTPGTPTVLGMRQGVDWAPRRRDTKEEGCLGSDWELFTGMTPPKQGQTAG